MSDAVKSRTLNIVLPAIFASLAVFMTLANIVFTFPILPYLRFELAEIPVVIVFLIMGPVPGLTSAGIYWAILNLVGEWVPIGPAMKFLSLAPTLVGLWIGISLYHRFFKGRKFGMATLGLGISFAIIARVIVTSLVNFVLLWYLFPSFLDIAVGSLTATLGLNISSPTAALLLTLLFTAIFNILHTFLSLLPSYMVVKTVAQVKIAGLGDLWIDKAVISSSPRYPDND